jgi:hypothetical protein
MKESRGNMRPTEASNIKIDIQRTILEMKEVKLSLNEAAVSRKLWDVEVPKFSRILAHRWRWHRQTYAPAALYPQEDSVYSFLLEAEPTSVP